MPNTGDDKVLDQSVYGRPAIVPIHGQASAARMTYAAVNTPQGRPQIWSGEEALALMLSRS